MRGELTFKDNHGYEYEVFFDYIKDRDIETGQKLAAVTVARVRYRGKHVNYPSLKSQVLKWMWREIEEYMEEA